MSDMFTPWYGFHMRPTKEGWYQGRNHETGRLFWVCFEPHSDLWQYIYRTSYTAEWRGLRADIGSPEFWESL